MEIRKASVQDLGQIMQVYDKARKFMRENGNAEQWGEVADKHQHTNLANITVDQAIKNNIHMDVVIEEDPDEEKGE